MYLAIITTKNDPSSKLFLAALPQEKKGEIILYEDILKEHVLIDQLKNYEKIILRDPYNTGENYSNILKIILDSFPKSIMLDYQCYKNFPSYEDKLFQSNLYAKYHIPSPKAIYVRYATKLANYPYLMKKRISSRNKGNHQVHSFSAVNKIIDDDKGNITDYIFQKIINVLREYRIIIYHGNIIGYVEKKIINGKLKIVPATKPPTTQQIDAAIAASKAMHVDFAGVDLVVSKENQHYVIETNVSPQFDKYVKVTKMNPAVFIFQTAAT